MKDRYRMDFTITARILLQSVYNTRSTSSFSWKRLCLMSHILKMSSVINCMVYFFCFKSNTLTTDTCAWLVCVEIAVIKAARKCVAKSKYNVLLSRLFIGIVLIEVTDYRHFFSYVICVKNFHSFNYCYFNCYYCCCYCCCFVLCFPLMCVTLTTRLPLTFTVTIQPHSRPIILKLYNCSHQPLAQ